MNRHAALIRVCQHFGVTEGEITGVSRHAHIVNARHVYAWLLRRCEGKSMRLVANEIGRGDHTTAMSAVRRVDGDAKLLRVARGILVACGESEPVHHSPWGRVRNEGEWFIYRKGCSC